MRRTRKATKIEKKKQQVNDSNTKWGIGKENAEKCSSCTATKRSESKRVKFMSGGNKIKPPDFEEEDIQDNEDCRENTDDQMDINQEENDQNAPKKNAQSNSKPEEDTEHHEQEEFEPSKDEAEECQFELRKHTRSKTRVKDKTQHNRENKSEITEDQVETGELGSARSKLHKNTASKEQDKRIISEDHMEEEVYVDTNVGKSIRKQRAEEKNKQHETELSGNLTETDRVERGQVEVELRTNTRRSKSKSTEQSESQSSVKSARLHLHEENLSPQVRRKVRGQREKAQTVVNLKKDTSSKSSVMKKSNSFGANSTSAPTSKTLQVLNTGKDRNNQINSRKPTASVSGPSTPKNSARQTLKSRNVAQASSSITQPWISPAQATPISRKRRSLSPRGGASPMIGSPLTNKKNAKGETPLHVACIKVSIYSTVEPSLLPTCVKRPLFQTLKCAFLL